MSNKWPAYNIEKRDISALSTYGKNSNIHSPGQIEQIAASMREFGWTMPVLVDDVGMIIAGHGRILAAEILGYEEVPVVVAHGWSDDQKRAYVMADNQIARNSQPDPALIAEEMLSLSASGFQIDLIGFDASVVENILGHVAAPAAAKEYDASTVEDRFWIQIKGPLRDQAMALDRLKAAMSDLGLVTVDLGTVQAI